MKYSLPLLFLLFVACNRENNEISPSQTYSSDLILKDDLAKVPDEPSLSRDQIDEIIFNEIRSSNDFRWNTKDVRFLWSASQFTPGIVIGYKPADISDINPLIGKIDMASGAWKEVHNKIINQILRDISVYENRNLTAADIIVEDDAVLPVIVLKIKNKNVLTNLFNLQNVRYIEPYGYWPAIAARSSSGCNASTTPLNTLDFTAELPGCKVPWNYYNMHVPAAWNIAQGNGISIGVIDAGISSTQSLLGSMFTNGYSNNSRTLSTDYTYGTSAYSTCTHGTSMCGLAAGPRNNQNAISGVAYKSGLYFIRGCDDVVLDAGSELSGVKNALVKIGDVSSVKIISMSIGTPFYSSLLYDGVNYAYNKGKMIFAAAGTSFSWTSWWGVVYPASFSQCIAVTGVNESGSTCNTCHDGTQVKFTVPMERNINNSRNSLSLPATGSIPTYIGGSSCATSTLAGIAALVWSVNPNLSRTQVFNCLRNTSQYYPNVSSSHGFGNVNAAAAVTMAAGL